MPNMILMETIWVLPKSYPPLTPQEVIDILKARGFEFKTQKGSHAQYEGEINRTKRKVTIPNGTNVED